MRAGPQGRRAKTAEHRVFDEQPNERADVVEQFLVILNAGVQSTREISVSWQ